MTVAHKMTKT